MTGPAHHTDSMIGAQPASCPARVLSGTCRGSLHHTPAPQLKRAKASETDEQSAACLNGITSGCSG